ncbi:hypothetical protein [Alkalicoccus daliensis]|uniref:Uncharacterized protein n=1 Tax=Alkalicoccus daliensis TaxID=745820 RepID=A0A1H0D317_9BACI|nr:hypothetical protein [Alkalicoccus daliensis]SDN64554.1 hypothetical protein SAMN04488053_102326 [Alkalicoccus daliensis]
MEEIGVPPKRLRNLIGESIEGHIITLAEFVKELDDHPPLLELRVNWPATGAFRAIFFYKEDEFNQYLYFTQAVIKKYTFSQEFEAAVIKSEKMMRNFFESQQKGDDSNDQEKFRRCYADVKASARD